MSGQVLEMSFDPATIEHLGVKMYSTLPPVLAELVANSYDANASTVTVYLNDTEGKEIIIKDDGYGMSFSDINQKFLRIGRNRRLEDVNNSSDARKIIGKKGLGKLAFFGIANEIEISTKKDGKENSFLMKWEDIKNSAVKEYRPRNLKFDVPCDEVAGTTIKLKNIKRETNFSAEEIADSLAKIFIIESGFKIFVQRNTEPPIEIQNERRYQGLLREVEWRVSQDIGLTSEYVHKNEVKGHLITSEKPISPKTNMRGIVLFSRKKLVNRPEYFSDSTSSHIFSYLTGWLEVDFIDDLEEDVISTDRQSLNWEHPDMVQLRAYLQSIIRWLEQDWRAKRSDIRQKKISQATGVNIPDWYNKLPEEIREKVKPVVDAIVKDAELSGTVGSQAVKNFHDLVPEYPKYHWRHLHLEIKNIAEDDYKNQRYFDAAEKASRLYTQRVKERSGLDSDNDSNAMDSAFNVGNGALLVTSCVDTTEKNIQIGQQLLSKGVVAGCRNPLTHNPEYQKKLVDTGLFTEKDCLDMLSLISHLFTRLDKAQKRP